MSQSAKNIETAKPSSLTWDPTDVAASLNGLVRYVEEEADKAANWYWRNKRWKSRLSQAIQFLAVSLTAAGGLVPIIGQLAGNPTLQSGLWASLFVGVAAALLALDRAFGLSSGWARYVLAGTNIRKAIEEFRLDWTSLIARAGMQPTSEQIEALIQRAKEFRITVEALVREETKEWVTEFQNNIARIEKEASAQLTTLKEQTDTLVQAEKVARQPGAIELTIANADKADGAEVTVDLEGQGGPLSKDTITGSKDWARVNVAPGMYRITASAALGGKLAATTAVVTVKPGEVAKTQLTLPVS